MGSLTAQNATIEIAGMLAMSEQRKGRALGGIARAAKLSPARRSNIGKAGAAARWGARPARIMRRGNFREEFGIDVDCYVLDDFQKTAVISQTGMAKALGLSSRGNAFPRFMSSKAMQEFVGADLRKKLENALTFQWGSGGADQPPATINGFDAALLIDVCQAILAASAAKKLNAARYGTIVAQAQIILGASAKLGIKDLVYALAGYSPSTEEVIAAFKHYVQEEARKYEAEFPNELYEQWHRLYEIPVFDRGKPWHFKHLTVNHIYYPLAQSDGRLLKLLRDSRSNSGNNRNKLFQFLNEVGARALRMHLGRVLEMAESSTDKIAYERRVADRFGTQGQFSFPPNPPPSA